MAKTYIPINEINKKFILNFIGLCRMSGVEQTGEPSFTFKDVREGIGTVIFDVFYRYNGIQEACWNMTVRVDTQVRLDSDAPAKKGETYCYLDSYKIEKGSLELTHKTSKFNIFSF